MTRLLISLSFSLIATSLTAAPLTPDSVSGLVGWYDAQQLFAADGTGISGWADKTQGGNNVVQNPAVQVTGDLPQGGLQSAVQPTLQSVTLNGFNYRSVRFANNATGEYDLLRAAGAVSDGDTDRTMILVYKGGIDEDRSRPGGFGSDNIDNNTGAIHWNLATDGNGSSRFDGAFISGYGAGLDNSQFVIRTAVMNSFTDFDEYGNALAPAFTDNQILTAGNPNNSLGSVNGDFFLGDLQDRQVGGELANTQFDFLEAIVYDGVLTTAQRQGVQEYLVNKYTTAAPAASGTLLSTDFDGSTAAGTTLSGVTYTTAPGISNASDITGDDSFRDGGVNTDNLSLDVNFNADPTTGFEFDFDVDSNFSGTLEGLSFDLAKTDGAENFNANPETQGWTITAEIFENATSLGAFTETFEVAGEETDFTTMDFFFPELLALQGGNNYTVDLSIIASQPSGGHFFSASNLQVFGTLEAVPEPGSLGQMLLMFAVVCGYLWYRK